MRAGLVPVVIGGLPRLEMITASGPLTGTFDPGITTQTSTTITCDYGDGTSETLTGTAHNFSHTYAVLGKWRAVFRGVPLSQITAIDCNTDLITSIKNLSGCNNLLTLYAYANVCAESLRNIPASCGDINVAGSYSALISGGLSDIKSNYTILKITYSNYITGSLADIKSSALTCYFFNSVGITPGTIAHLNAVRDIRIYSMGWNAAGVDLVLLSAADAVWANAAHYTYLAPVMQIQSNAVPGGSAGADTTDPMTTPGSGNSNTDWQWDETAGKHKALTGKAAIYFLAHNTGHAWLITYQLV
jgi:hypothetical protein